MSEICNPQYVRKLNIAFENDLKPQPVAKIVNGSEKRLKTYAASLPPSHPHTRS